MVAAADTTAAVAASPEGRLEELGWLDVKSRYSRVRSLAYPVDPLRRLRGAATPWAEGAADGRRLAALTAISEWAYGYRDRRHSVRPLTRRAPSAGALYPTEVMFVGRFEGAWRLLHHDYPLGRPRLLGGAEAESLAAALGLHEDEQALLLTTVLWRSAQRYGARSYLYALLDAGHVAANFARLTAHFGGAASVIASAPIEQLQGLLGLRPGEALVAALRLELPAAAGAVPPPPAASLERLAAPATLQPPALSPLLRRVDAMHRRSFSPAKSHLALGWLAGERRADLLALVERRRSAVAFSPQPLAGGDWEALRGGCLRSLAAQRAEGGPPLCAYAVFSRLEGRPPGVVDLTAPSPGSAAGFASTAGAGAALREACQAQAIAGEAAVTIVLGLPLAELPRGGQSEFRVAALSAGAVCAHFYLEAARLGVGTTSVGGFDADLLRRLLGEAEVCPLVAQAFGVEADVGSKDDVVPVADRGGRAER